MRGLQASSELGTVESGGGGGCAAQVVVGGVSEDGWDWPARTVVMQTVPCPRCASRLDKTFRHAMQGMMASVMREYNPL
jgi:hypothetical protein